MLTTVKTQAFSGDYKLNPFNFLHSNVNWIELSVDGLSVPGQPLKPNFEMGDYTSSFLSMFFNNYPHPEAIGFLAKNTSTAIPSFVLTFKARSRGIYLARRELDTPNW